MTDDIFPASNDPEVNSSFENIPDRYVTSTEGDTTDATVIVSANASNAHAVSAEDLKRRSSQKKSKRKRKDSSPIVPKTPRRDKLLQTSRGAEQLEAITPTVNNVSRHTPSVESIRREADNAAESHATSPTDKPLTYVVPTIPSTLEPYTYEHDAEDVKTSNVTKYVVIVIIVVLLLGTIGLYIGIYVFRKRQHAKALSAAKEVVERGVSGGDVKPEEVDDINVSTTASTASVRPRDAKGRFVKRMRSESKCKVSV